MKQPLIIETIKTTEKVHNSPVFEKQEIKTKVPVPDGHIRVIVLIDHKGMLDNLYAGDVLDIPERRYKTLVNRGFVREYDGTRLPNKER